MISTKNHSQHSRACGGKTRIVWRRVDGIIALVILCIVTAQHPDYSVDHAWRVLHFFPIFSFFNCISVRSRCGLKHSDESVSYTPFRKTSLLFAQVAVLETMPPLLSPRSDYSWLPLGRTSSRPLLIYLIRNFASHSSHCCTYYLLTVTHDFNLFWSIDERLHYQEAIIL